MEYQYSMRYYTAGGTRLDLEIERTDMPVQRVWRSTLGKLVSDIKEEDPTCVSVSPAVLVVGATAALDLLHRNTENQH
jgi:siroheme synthase